MKSLDAFKASGDKQDYAGMIASLRDAAARDKAVFRDAAVKAWCGQRWRNLFLTECENDPAAVKTASRKKKDPRPPRQRVAERFLKGDEINEWTLAMPALDQVHVRNTTLVFVPGLLNGILPTPAFEHAMPAVESKHGFKILRADIHPFRGCEANGADIAATVDQGLGQNAHSEPIHPDNATPPKDIFLMGYSKGVPDTLTFLVNRPDVARRVRCLFDWAGAPGGSYMADALYNDIKDKQIELVHETLDVFLRLVAPTLRIKGALRRMAEYDIKGAMHDLTTTERKRFLDDHGDKLEAMNIPMFNLTGATTLLEVPYFQAKDYLGLSKFDANNDMQVTQAQAKIPLPMATDLAMLRGHHWDLSYSPFPPSQRLGSPNLDHPFPKEAALTAIFKFAAELGLVD